MLYNVLIENLRNNFRNIDISAVSNALLNPMKLVTSAKAEITAFVNFSFILFLKINPSALPRRTIATFCSDRVRLRLSFFAFAILALLLCCFDISGNIPCVIAIVFTFGQKLYHNLICRKQQFPFSYARFDDEAYQ